MMSRYHSYINSAKEILKKYKGDEPFASFLKKYFSENKKYGSRDRKQISHLCYCYFRLGKAAKELPVEERLLVGLFLCSVSSNEMLNELKQEWNTNATGSLREKLSIFNFQFSLPDVFPWQEELSPDIDHEKFCQSFFMQPDLFLRLRPGKEDAVKGKLNDAGIKFEIISDTCLALLNASKIDKVIELDKEASVQDYNSQKTGDLLKSAIANLKSEITAWDCCAGSGGKSIMLYDLYSNIDLTVSDVRESILINLKKRFREAGIAGFKSMVADLTRSPLTIHHLPSNFELIICDAPCTGSGTWGRTPEQLSFFGHETIGQFSHLQKKIISNVIPCLKPGGYLLYITCSVFRKENEEIVDFIKQNFHFQLINMEVLNGYDKKADTMFVALLKKSL